MTDAQANGILSAIQDLGKRFDRLEERFDALEERFDALEEAVGANASKIADMHNFTQRFYADFQEFRVEMNGR